MSCDSMLSFTCTIRRKTGSQSGTGSGAMQYAWADNATGVPVQIQMDSSSERRRAGAETGETNYALFFAYATDIKHTDRINTIVDRGTAEARAEWSGRTLSITSPPMDDAGRRAYYRCSAVEVKADGGTL